MQRDNEPKFNKLERPYYKCLQFFIFRILLLFILRFNFSKNEIFSKNVDISSNDSEGFINYSSIAKDKNFNYFLCCTKEKREVKMHYKY